MSIGDLIDGLFSPGGALHERDQAVRPMMERHGLRFCYFLYQAPEGTSPFSFSSQTASAKRQIADLGGPFELLHPAVQPLTEVYEGNFDGTLVTIGHFSAGGPEIHMRSTQREYLAAVVTIPGADLGTFCTVPRGFFRRKPVLSATVQDLLSREPEWRVEGKQDRLVLRSSGSPTDRNFTVPEIKHFVDGVFRIAPLFGARVSR